MEGLSDSAKSRLWRSIAGRQPEFPVFYQVFSVVPFVCPGEDYDAAAALLEDCSDLPFQSAGLFLLAVAKAVQPGLAEEHGTIIA